MALRLADIGPSGWRLVYVVSLVWCVVALDLARRLPESRRFVAAHITAHSHRPPMNRQTAAAAVGRRLHRQHLHRPGQLLPEPVPHRRPGLLGRDDRRVLHRRRHPGRARAHRRRPHGRHGRPTTVDRRSPFRCRPSRSSVRSWSPASGCGSCRCSAASSPARRTRHSPSTGWRCSRPAIAAGPPGW